MIAVLLVLLCICAAAWDRYYNRKWNRGVRVTINFSRPSTYVGKTFELTEVIENRKRLPVPVMEIAFRVPTGIRFVDAENTQISDYIYKKDLFSMLGMESITRKYEMEASDRGCYDVSQVVCEAPSLLHIYRFRMECDTTDRIFAYAKRVNVSGILTSVETLLGEMESSRKIYEDPFAFASIREYTLQDPMKTINWKASAKTGGLMVNTYTSVRSEEVEIYLDIEDSAILKAAPLIEHSISIAATLTEKLLHAGRNVSLRMNMAPSEEEKNTYMHYMQERGGTVLFPMGTGEDRHQAIEQFLTGRMVDRTVVSFAHILEDSDKDPSKTPSVSRIRILISKNADNEWIRQNRSLITEESILVVPIRPGAPPPDPAAGVRIVAMEI